MCERELETEQNCIILTPTLLAITTLLSRSLRLLNHGPGGPASLGHVPQSSIFSPTGLLSKLSIGGSEAPFVGCWLSLSLLSPTGLVPKLTDFLSPPSYIIVQRPLLLVGVTIALIQPIHSQGYNSDIPRPDAPVICIEAFPILTAQPGRMSIYNNDTSFHTKFKKQFSKQNNIITKSKISVTKNTLAVYRKKEK